MFFEKLKLYREQLDMSLQDIADYLHVELSVVEKWETGVSMPNIESIIQLSDLFQVSIDFLLKDSRSDTEYSYYTRVKEEKPIWTNNMIIALAIYILSVLGLFSLLIVSLLEPIVFTELTSGETYTGFLAYCHTYSEYCFTFYASIVGFILSAIYLIIPEAKRKKIFHKKNK